jgi:hypothetical protein
MHWRNNTNEKSGSHVLYNIAKGSLEEPDMCAVKSETCGLKPSAIHGTLYLNHLPSERVDIGSIEDLL